MTEQGIETLGQVIPDAVNRHDDADQRRFGHRIAGYRLIRHRDGPPAYPMGSACASGSRSPAGMSGWSTFSLDGHQFQRPSRTTVDGTSNVLTRKVSIK